MSKGGSKRDGERNVGDTLREAIEGTLSATTGSASATRERAGELVDEVVRRAGGAGHELTRLGQLTGAELARRGQDAGAELARRLEALERRLAEVEESLRREAGQGAGQRPEGPDGPEDESNPKGEG